MAKVRLLQGKPLMVGGKVALSDDCCCGGTTGACCVGFDCSQTTQDECENVLGGIFLGVGTECGSPNPCCQFCCSSIASITISGDVTADIACGTPLCPCFGGPFVTITSTTLSGGNVGPCINGAVADGETDFDCLDVCGLPGTSASHIDITFFELGGGMCQVGLTGWIDVNCGIFVSRRAGLDHVADPVACTSLGGSHSFNFSGVNGAGDTVTVNINVVITL